MEYVPCTTDPVFIKDSDIWNDNLKVTNLEMCNILNVATKGALIGAQRVRSVWQIYGKNLDTRRLLI